jgi:hypothetical protein
LLDFGELSFAASFCFYMVLVKKVWSKIARLNFYMKCVRDFACFELKKRFWPICALFYKRCKAAVLFGFKAGENWM